MAYLTTDGAEIYYDTYGAGPAVVLGHGAEGNVLSWYQQVPVLAQAYQTVVFDHRGFGRSVCAPEALQPARFGSDMVAVMDALGVERAVVVAQSMAGWGAMQAALAVPSRIAAVMLVATSGGLTPPGGDDAPPPDPNARPLAGRLSGVALAPGFADRDPERAWLFDQVSLDNRHIETLAARLGQPENLIVPTQLSRYAVPTLIVAGEYDTFFPPALLETVCKAIPGARLVTIAGAGHAPYWETPAVFNKVLLDFLAQYAVLA